ncbi:hypothetical protein GCM10027035_22520 [Emticicia sediminis]
MNPKNNLEIQTQSEINDSENRLIKKISYKIIIGTGIIVSIIVVLYKYSDKIINYYHKIYDYYNIIKDLFFLRIGYKLTNNCVKKITELNNFKNKFISVPTINRTSIINRTKNITEIINKVFKGTSKFIKK